MPVETDKKLSKIFADNIVAQRKRLNLSQKELAAILEMSVDGMSRLERGVMTPKFSRLEDIAKALQCSVAFLLLDTDKHQTEKGIAISNLLTKLSPQQQESVMKVLYATIEGYIQSNDE